MSLKQIRLSAQAREQLIRLKTRTTIPQWNILCRWAFCLSLRQPAPPTPVEIPADSNVEMTWQVFDGEAVQEQGAGPQAEYPGDGAALLGVAEHLVGRPDLFGGRRGKGRLGG